MPPTSFPKVAWVVFVEVHLGVVEATSITCPLTLLPVLAIRPWLWLMWSRSFRVFLSLDGMSVAQMQDLFAFPPNSFASPLLIN